MKKDGSSVYVTNLEVVGKTMVPKLLPLVAIYPHNFVFSILRTCVVGL